MSHSVSVLERKKKRRNKYTSHDVVLMVVVNALNPIETLREFLNPCSRQRLNYLLVNGEENELYFKQRHNKTLVVLLEKYLEDVVSSLTPNSIETIPTSKELIRPNYSTNKNRSSSRISDITKRTR